MEETPDKEVTAFIDELVKLNKQIADLFDSGNVALFTDINATVKEMYRLQHTAESGALKAVEEECRVIYGNFDMIVSVLRTTEDGEIDKGAQGAINKFLHNIHEATVNIAAMFGLI